MEHHPKYAIAISLAKKPFQDVYMYTPTPAGVPADEPVYTKPVMLSRQNRTQSLLFRPPANVDNDADARDEMNASDRAGRKVSTARVPARLTVPGPKRRRGTDQGWWLLDSDSREMKTNA
jgi:hypothetical protein